MNWVWSTDSPGNVEPKDKPLKDNCPVYRARDGVQGVSYMGLEACPSSVKQRPVERV